MSDSLNKRLLFSTLVQIANVTPFLLDLVYFTKRVPDKSDTSVTRVRHERQEWDTSETRATRVLHNRHECGTSATRTTRVRYGWKILIFTMRRGKIYSHTPLLAIWQMKNYKERNNIILRTNFWKCLVPMPKSVWKVHDKNWTL